MRHSLISLPALSLVAVSLLGWQTACVAPSFAAEPAGVIAIAEIKRDTPVDFAQEILPILKQNCLACHNASEAESGLNLESPEAILKGGDSGPTVDIKESLESLLLLRATGEMEPLMPPPDNKVAARALTPEELGLIKLWIEQGATGMGSGVQALDWQPLPPGVNPIYAVAISPDGQYAACGRANQIFIYHLPTGRFVCQLTDPELLQAGIYQKAGVADLDLIQSLAFSPDGMTLASGGYRTVKLWQRPSNVKQWSLDAAASAAVQSVAASTDGKWLATAGTDGVIQLFDSATGKVAASLSGHTAAVTSMRFAADGARLFSASADKSVRVWSVPSGQTLARIDTPTPLAALTLVGDQSQLATGGGDNLIRLWNVPSVPAPAIADLPAAARAVAISADQATLAVAAEDGQIQIVDLATGQVQKTLTGHAGAVNSLKFAAATGQLVSAGADGTLRVWDLATGQPLTILAGNSAPVQAVAVTAAGNLAASGSADGAVKLWKLDLPAPRVLGAADEAVAGLGVASADGKLVATVTTVGGQPAVVVRDVASGSTVAKLSGHTAAIHAVAFSADATRVITGSLDHTARVWNLADGKPLISFAGHGQPVTAVAFTPNAQQAVSGAADNSLKLWNVADAALVKDLPGHTGAIVATAVTANGQQLVSASADQTVRVWNVADGQLIRAVAVGTPATALAISRDDALLAVGGADFQVRLVQLADGQIIKTLPGHATAIKSVAFSAGSTRLLSVATDNRIHLSDVATGVLLEAPLPASGATFGAFGATDRDLLLGRADHSVVHVIGALERVLPPHTLPVTGLEFKPDGSLVYSAGEDGAVRGFQTADGAQRFSTTHNAAVHGLAISPDGQWLASAGADQMVRLWNADNGAPAAQPQLAGCTSPVRRVSFSKDGTRVIAAGTNAGELLVFNVATATLEQAYAEHAAPVGALAAGGKEGDWIVSTAANQVRVWPLLLRRQIAGHGQPVTSLDVLPAEPLQIIAGSLDGTVRQWNSDNGQQVRQWDHGGPVMAVAVRPDGLRVASAGANKLARLWNTQDNQLVSELRGDHRVAAKIVQVEREINLAKGKVAFLTNEVTEAEKRATAESEALKVAMEAVPPAEKTLAEKTEATTKATAEKTAADQASADAVVAAKTAEEAKAAAAQAMIDADAAQKAATAAVAAAQVALDADAANATLVAAKATADQALVDANAKLTAATEAKTTTERLATEAAQKVTQTAEDAKNKAKAAEKAEMERKQAEIVRNSAVKTVESGTAAVQRAAERVPLIKNDLAAADMAQKNVEATLEPTRQAATATETPLAAIAFSPDNLLLAVAGEDKLVHTYNATDGAALDVLTGHAAPVVALAFTGQRGLVTGAAEKAAAVWDIAPVWTWKQTIGGPDSSQLMDRVTSLAFSPDGTVVASGSGEPSRGGEVKLWTVADGTLIRDLTDAHSDVVLGLDFSADGQYLASCGADKFIKVHEVATGSFVKAFEGHTHHVLGVGWKADGRMLASAGADNAIKVWDFNTGEQKLTIAGYTKEVSALVFMGDTANTLSCSGDRTVRIHNTDNGQNVLNFAGNEDFVYSVAASADGKVVIAGGQDSVLRVWNGADAKELGKFGPPAAEPTQK